MQKCRLSENIRYSVLLHLGLFLTTETMAVGRVIGRVVERV